MFLDKDIYKPRNERDQVLRGARERTESEQPVGHTSSDYDWITQQPAKDISRKGRRCDARWQDVRAHTANAIVYRPTSIKAHPVPAWPANDWLCAVADCWTEIWTPDTICRVSSRRPNDLPAPWMKVDRVAATTGKINLTTPATLLFNQRI